MTIPRIYLGIDIGSITVKLVAWDPDAGALLWSGYRRHHARQQETTLALLEDVRRELNLPADVPVAVTGSGAQEASEQQGFPYVQEVNALMRAVRTLHPEVRSIIELGGEDAKMVSIDLLENGEARLLPVMNEKCAAGTGSMIDRMTARMGFSPEQAAEIEYVPGKRHPIAAKCGVFAETDVVGLLKNGVAREELLRALFESIVQQNLSTLARGRTPMPRVLLLGGPHCYYPGLVQCWRHRLAEIWQTRGLSTDCECGDAVVVPEHALFLPAIGAVLEFMESGSPVQDFTGVEERLRKATTRTISKLPSQIAFSNDEDRQSFTQEFTPAAFFAPDLSGRGIVRAHLGIDCGSTSVKAVLLGEDFTVLRRQFAFATHDPIADARRMIRELRESVTVQGTELVIESLGTTGYAKDILAAALRADIAVVETVAHTESVHRYFPHADVVCDVGGQDIKVMLLQQGGVADFRLNTQCSAGTGYFLQSVAQRFDTSIYDFAEEALSAQFAPEFSAGCTIFLQSDIVNFMRAGYTPAEIMAGVTQVLPLNVWVYAARLYDLPAAGNVFVLQGGTQRNLAAVRAQVQYIREAFRDSGRQPEIHVHPHPAEAGAIGCALLAARTVAGSTGAGSTVAGSTGAGSRGNWIGFDALNVLEYSAEQSEETRCRGCSNHCARTVLHLGSSIDCVDQTHDDAQEESIIIAPCERGRAADAEQQRRVRTKEKKREKSAPNYARLLESTAFSPSRIAAELRSMLGREEVALEETASASNRCVCIPRVMNFHSYAPMFIAWFLAMGFGEEDIHISPRTTRKMSSSGTARATIDPCFPAKICFAHIEALLETAAASRKDALLFFPAMLKLPTTISDPEDSMTCTVAAVMPEVVNAAYSLETDEFKRHGTEYLHPFLSLANLDEFSTTMAECFAPLLGASRRTMRRAAEIAWALQDRLMLSLQEEARQTLARLEREQRVGFVMLGRSYHADRGLNHGVIDALQEMGFPVFTAETLPRDSATLARVFEGEDALTVRDVWPNPFSENSSRKMWAAKYTARHPNLLPLELSNFKCGHDAPTYSLMRAIFKAARKPLFSFLDLDENTPQNTLNIRLETIRHFLDDWCTEQGYVSPRNKQQEASCLQSV